MATVYLHIGTPKTGTTAIQNFLSDNNEVLNKYGICYPDLGFRYSGIGMLRNAHFLLTSYTDENGKQPGKDYEPGLDKLAELADSYDKIIISDEAIWRGSQSRKDFWTRLKYDFWKRNLDFKVIVYLRRQDLWVQSFWGQKIKKGAEYDFKGYLQNLEEIGYPTNYYKYMNTLSSVFGEKSIIIRVYEKGQYQGEQHTLISDFLNIFGLPLTDEFCIKQTLYNLSLNGNYLEIRRMLNALPDFPANGKALKKSIWELQKLYPEADQAQNYTWANPEEQRAYLDSFAQSNEDLARKYLHRTNGILFYDPVEDFPERIPDEKALFHDAFLICCEAIQQLEQNNRMLDLELQSVKSELKNIRENVLLYRLKRKIKHILGKDKSSNASI